MKKLIYCVFSMASRRAPPSVRGLDDHPVELVFLKTLCAATSPVEEAPLPATLERVQGYERVVEAFFRHRTIVPMRFGSILDSDAEVVRYLRENAAGFRAQLREISGCVEMGIRVMAPTRVAETRAPAVSGPRREKPGPGHAYLATRARDFRSSDAQPASNPRRLVERYRDGLQGLYTAIKVDQPTPTALVVGADGVSSLRMPGGDGASSRLPALGAAQRGALSLSFLVPRRRVDAFHRAFGRIRQGAAVGHLSGPWPPYSFVSGMERGAGRGGRGPRSGDREEGHSTRLA